MKSKNNPYLILVIIYAAIIILCYIFLRDIANSNALVAFTTFTVGGLALYIYTKQKADEKINAATSILLEIRNAEEKIDSIRQRLNSGNTVDLPTVLPINSWMKYSHLFAKDFDEDELKLINSFYSSCTNIEDLINRQNNFIWVATEERGKSAQRLLGDIHVEFQRDISNGMTVEVAQRKFNSEKEGITKFYGDEEYFYAPQKTINGLKFEIGGFQKITTTTCGSKLKILAHF